MAGETHNPAPDIPRIQHARRFIAGTARWFTMVGLALMLLSCTLGLFGGSLLGRHPEPATSLKDFLSSERWPFTVKAAGLLVTIVASLAFQAVSLALGGELPRGARTATVAAGLATFMWTGCGVALLLTRDQRLAAAPFILLALAGAGLTLLAFRCTLLQQELPPVDRERLVRETLEAYEQRRRQRGPMP